MCIRDRLKTTLEQLASAQSLPALDELLQRFTVNLKLLQRRLQDVSDPDRKASGLRYLDTLRGGLDATGLFAIRRQHLEAQVPVSYTHLDVYKRQGHG